MPQAAESTDASTPVDPESLPSITINLEYGDTPGWVCKKFPRDLYARATAPNRAHPGFGFLEVNTAVIVLTDNPEEDWWKSPNSYLMRQKIRRAQKLGYEFRRFEHNDFIDDIYEINTSLESRQGGRMSESYTAKPTPEPSLANQPCLRHRLHYFGVFLEGKLVAYTYVMQCGEVMVFTRLLGHGAHLENGVMNLLVYRAAEACHEESGTRYAIYHLQDNGSQGLQFFKRKMGFVGHRVTWELARPGVKVNLRRPRRGSAAARSMYSKVWHRFPVVKTALYKARKIRSKLPI